ncbi:MAG: hypothetical protein ACTSYI_12300 [Promethearchaeota archaeon]
MFLKYSENSRKILLSYPELADKLDNDEIPITLFHACMVMASSDVEVTIGETTAPLWQHLGFNSKEHAIQIQASWGIVIDPAGETTYLNELYKWWGIFDAYQSIRDVNEILLFIRNGARLPRLELHFRKRFSQRP